MLFISFYAVSSAFLKKVLDLKKNWKKIPNELDGIIIQENGLGKERRATESGEEAERKRKTKEFTRIHMHTLSGVPL
jgi:hypothetical protein